MSAPGRADEGRDEASNSDLVPLKGRRLRDTNGGLRRDLNSGFCRDRNGGFSRDIPLCPKPKNASSRYAGASSTEDESGWESEADVETDIESGMDSEIGEDDDGFEADSEGDFGQSPIAKIASFPNGFSSTIGGGFHIGHVLTKPPMPVVPFNKFFFVPSTGEFVALETDCENDTDVDKDGDEVEDDAELAILSTNQSVHAICELCF